MDWLILGSLLLTGGLLSLAGVFDGGDDKEDTPSDDAHRGTEGDDTLSGDSGMLSGWEGNDTLHLSGTAIRAMTRCPPKTTARLMVVWARIVCSCTMPRSDMAMLATTR